jgi:hypothetical protein
MALHRDIYWVGRQWAVTGAGIQAVDQKRRSAFDIEVDSIWDDGLAARMRAQAWLNGEDFDSALAIARSRFPEPPRKPLPLIESVLELIQPAPAEPWKPVALPPQNISRHSEPPPARPLQAAPPMQPPPPMPQLHVEGSLARFLPQWRVRR